MEKIFIQNRKNQKICVLIEQPAGIEKGLAFVMHGLGGFKDQPHIAVFAKAFLDNGYTVVRFDTTNTFGESDGQYEDATVTNYYEDLEDLISWAKGRSWYQEPFCLVGHSLGGICTALYAERHPEKVKALAPISTVVSGELSVDCRNPDETKEWERTGWRIEPSLSRPGHFKKLKWAHMLDRLKYDLLPEVGRLAMPVLLIVGDQDTHTPSAHQQILLDAIPGSKKEMHVVKNAPHTFRAPEHLEEISDIFNKWIEKYG